MKPAEARQGAGFERRRRRIGLAAAARARAQPYRGRFAPSPTGPLHLGSLVAALASWLDAAVHRGEWLVRIEDIDTERAVPGAAAQILHALEFHGMRAPQPLLWQSRRRSVYQRAFGELNADGRVYPCGCTRKEIADSLQAEHRRHSTLAYRGTCRGGLHGRAARAWRFRLPPLARATVRFEDRWCGRWEQNVALDVGDFVLKRADGQWAYQLAVVVDDGEAGITDVVRGADLIDSTPRQILLQRALGLPTPRYLHVPLVLDAHGDKLGKQTGAMPLELHGSPLPALHRAARHLGLDIDATTLEGFYRQASAAWDARFGPGGAQTRRAP